MGMFDYFTITSNNFFKPSCSKCNFNDLSFTEQELNELKIGDLYSNNKDYKLFQTKNLECFMNNYVLDINLCCLSCSKIINNDHVSIYTICPECKSWIEYTLFFEDGVLKDFLREEKR
jgi:hypothetical protein